jgi:hypothetical protein
MEGDTDGQRILAEIDGLGTIKSVLATWRIVSTGSQTRTRFRLTPRFALEELVFSRIALQT